MDDDGLVLNLNFDPPFRRQPGASKTPSANSSASPAGNAHKRAHDTGSTARPPKRARLDAPGDPDAHPQPHLSKPARPARPAQIISSLFSSNPSNPIAPSSFPAPSAQKASNAPLKDASSFAGLGLHPLLVAHLRGKMGIDRPTAIQRASLGALLRPGSSAFSEADVSLSEHTLPASHVDDAAAGPASQAPEERDVFIQSQTGSGKTLAYLLPLVQDLFPLSSLSYIDRSVGTLAIVLAPTRELAKQIYDVLVLLLSLRLSPSAGGDAAGETDEPQRLTRWLVPGLLTGGATRTHEKARLRKGVPILVSTPGRLLDHLQSTAAFSVGKLRWLVLDEADRLMDLGFEDTIAGILRALEGRRRMALSAMEQGRSGDVGAGVGGWDWARRRRTVLCSATMREDVQKLAGTALSRPVVIKGHLGGEDAEREQALMASLTLPKLPGEKKKEEAFTPPAQLAQKYVVVPLKLRLVALVALLRMLLARTGGEDEKRTGKEREKEGVGAGRRRVIVFLSCTDAVDFLWTMLGGATMGGPPASATQADEDATLGGKAAEAHKSGEDGADERKAAAPKPAEELARHSSLLPNTALYRLHGSLPLQTRLASLQGFTTLGRGKSSPDSSPDSGSAVLFCTSVASRGLDLPRVQAVVQYDLPTEGGATEYVHRVGRTARVGRGGEAWAIVSPAEAEWVAWVEERMDGGSDAGAAAGVGTAKGMGTGKGKSTLSPVEVDDVLRAGFGGRKMEFEQRATQVQLAFERWALARKENSALARKAFASHIRAYATHPSDEKHLFHVRNLHLGHLAKSFALRDAPSNMNGAGFGGAGGAGAGAGAGGGAGKGTKREKREKAGADVNEKMRQAIRKQARASAGGEFQIASAVTL